MGTEEGWRTDSMDASIAINEHLPSDVCNDHGQTTGLEDTTLNRVQPRPWHAPMTVVSLKLWRQFLGLNPFKGSYFGLYWSLSGSRERTVAWYGALFAMAAGVPLPVIGVIFGKIISSFPPDEAELRTRIVQLLGVAVAYFSFTTVYTICFARTGERIAIRLREQLLLSLMYVDQAYLDVEGLDYNGLLRDSIDTIQVGCSEKFGIFLQSISYFVAAFVVGFILNAKLTGILFAAVIPTMIAVVTFGSISISKLTHRISDHTERASAIALSSLRSVQIVQAFNIIEHICTSHQEQLDESSKFGMRKAVVSAFELGCAYFIAYAANGLAFFVGSHMAAAGKFGGDSGTIYAVVFLILDASFVVGQFAPFLEIFARAASAYGKIGGVIESCSARASAKASNTTGPPTDIHDKPIRLDDVKFTYPARSDIPVLQGLTLHLRPGAFNAIVGTSGGGKSTLLSLLLRIYHDYSGGIFIGAQELREIDVYQLRSQVAVLDQDCVLFSGTIFENICHGLAERGLTDRERAMRIDEAVTAAGIDFLTDLPNGIHTKIDNTLQLSGGQRQRVCLARALISRPAMLVLDEPTSALDARSELKVMDAIRRAVSRGMTVVMVAHRLSTVLAADEIVVVQDGRAIEQGPPSALIATGSVFSGLLAAQNTHAEAQAYHGDFAESSTSGSEKSVQLDSPADDQSQDDSDEVAIPALRTVIRRFVQLTRPDHIMICFGILGSIVSGGLIIGEAIIFGNLVQLLNSDKDSPRFQPEANFYCLMFFILACIALISFVGSGTAFGFASARVIARVRSMLLHRVLQLDVTWFSKSMRSPTELSSVIAKDSSDLACLSGVALGTLFTVVVSVLGGIILAHVVAWKIAIVLLSAVPIMVASGFIRLRLLSKSERRHRTAYSDATSFAVEVCHGRRTVTMLGMEEYNLQRYHEALRRPYKEGLLPTILCNSLLALSLAITYFVYALAYWWGSKQVRNGLYNQREFFTVLPALLFSAQSAGQLFSLSPEIARAKTAALSIFGLLSFQPTILTPPTGGDCHVCEPSPPKIDDLKGGLPKIEFQSVSFSYSAGSKIRVLQDISLNIYDGQTVALVGPSGAGKSSIIALIERLYDPSTGRILFNGVDVRNHDVRKVRSRMSILSQSPELFPGSIEYNIRLGASDRAVSRVEIEEVAMQCGIHDFISSLPDGYCTECGAVANSQLSTGQRQRVALARALVRNPEVLLLDEPTSALDAHSERHIQDALQAASKGRTTVIVAHRLASIQHADKIIVLDCGKIVEHGTHVELVEMGGLYARMARAQALA